MTKVARLEDFFTTHQGCVREANEDSLACRSRERVWAVADGMGGHKNGQYASRKVASAIEEAQIPEDLDAACEAVCEAIRRASDQLYTESRASGEQMGSTVVSLIVRDGTYAILWVGDSRAYLYRGGELRQLTRDHTQVQEMVDRGLLDPEAAANHPLSHVLARAVGVMAEFDIDKIIDETEIGDVFLLCSDGLHGVLSSEEITQALQNPSRRSAEELVQACLARGAPDNVTVTIVRVFESSTLTFTGSREKL